jgi:hypothetical protein
MVATKSHLSATDGRGNDGDEAKAEQANDRFGLEGGGEEVEENHGEKGYSAEDGCQEEKNAGKKDESGGQP